MNVERHAWWSPSLERPMELLWYGSWGRPVLMFPTSTGGPRQNEDGGLIGSLADKIDAGEIQICSVDSIDTEHWYNEWAHPSGRVYRYMQFDNYLANEVIPLIGRKAERADVVTFGASFGAYHAINFAGRHPELVSRAIAFSGVYDIHRLLNGYWDDNCYFNCPSAYFPNLPEPELDRMRHIGWVIATGEFDHLVQENRWFAGMLAGKGLNVHAEIWEGQFGHDWPFWNEHLRRFLP